MRQTLLASFLIVGCGTVDPIGNGDGSGSESSSTGAGSDASDDTVLPDPSVTTTTSSTSSDAGTEGTTSGATTMMTFTTADSEEATGETIGFIMDPDGGVGCFAGVGPDGTFLSCECDVWEQDCPAGDRCTGWANDGSDVWNATRCRPLDPDPRAVGESCTIQRLEASGVDDCGPDSMCFNADPESLEGTCTALCAGDTLNPECADGTTCVLASQGVLTLCLETCDPLAQDCGEGFGCYADGEPGRGGAAFCLREGIGLMLTSSPFDYTRVADCPVGTTAVEPELVASCEEEELCCAAWCSLSDAQGCETDEVCELWSGPTSPVQLDDIGVCIAAQ